MSDFYRIKRLPPYVFEQVNRIKEAARAKEAKAAGAAVEAPKPPVVPPAAR